MTVSTPATPVVLTAARARELAAAVGAALANVAAHAGDAARAWVLVEDDGDEVRGERARRRGRDAPGRLDEAAADGRLGVAASISGRVRELGGTVAVESAPGGGTEVEMRVPTMTGRVTRVMVVDDHPMWREGVARDLAEGGFEVVATAGDGAEAVRRAPAARPDVVVLDLQLPVLSGVEVTRELVGSLDPPPRVLVLSASGEQADVLEAVKAGATGYLVKSASREELLDAVRRTADGVAVFTPGLAGLVLGEYRRLSSGPPPASGPPRAAADRPRDRGAAAGGEGAVLQGHRRAARALAPHRAEPRAEHPEQAAAAQPGRSWCATRSSRARRRARHPAGHLTLAARAAAAPVRGRASRIRRSATALLAGRRRIGARGRPLAAPPSESSQPGRAPVGDLAGDRLDHAPGPSPAGT